MSKKTTICRLCNSKRTEELIADEGLKHEKVYHHCKDCDFIFVDEAFILPPEEEEKRYVNHNNTIENKGYVRMFREFIENALQKEFEACKMVLDFGCGPGPVLAEIMKQSGKMVDYYDPYYFKDDSIFLKKYDLITSTEVFEHIKYPLISLQTLSNLLNEGGILAIMTRFHTGIENFEEWWYRRDVTHISFVNLKTVEKINALTDFKLLRTDEKSYFVLKKQTDS